MLDASFIFMRNYNVPLAFQRVYRG
ncbi:unnamed protein product, partial [Vitis vinifera]